ncbi:MAG TPA: bifunctional aspartate kinase/diaminopimelate decarboxylase [Xanthomonadaceae bacterium]|nr:bifunctional aspartate kinase/diaminopimelate decarboxylase [Xanthomonadaceae bacterium]
MTPGSSAPAAASGRWIVLKFGGTSVSQRARWDGIRAIAAARRDDGLRVLIVVSALTGVTNALQALAEGDGAAGPVLAELAQRHRAFAAELGLDADAVIGGRLAALEALAVDPRARARTLPWQAELLAQGELLSSALGAAWLSVGGIATTWCDARGFLSARRLPHHSEWATRLSAVCETPADPAWQARFAEQGQVVITQGFVARSEDGSTVVLGRGGSDTSAAYFGALLDAVRVEIWTDVPGMFSANPRQVPDARLLTGLDYDEAQEIATTGARVLHPRSIAPCREARVPIQIRDSAHPQLPGTTIGALARTVPGVKAISTRRGIVLVSMETVGMWQQVGFLADVFEQFKRHGLSVDLIGSSETNVTVSLDPSDNLVSSNVLEALCTDLARVCRVKVIAPCSAVTLVGRGMRSLLHRLTDVMAEFGRERVHLISQSSNDLNLTFVVDQDLGEGMLPRLHELLIHAGAMPVQDKDVFGPSWRRLADAAAAAPPAWWRARRERLLELAARGTPRYVYDLDTVRARARALKAVAALDARLYALKANAHPAILRVLEAEGFGFECVSRGELEHVFATLPGLDPARVLFTPSFAPRSEYERAFALGVHVTLDSIWPLQQWPELLRGRSVFLRLDPGFGRGHHEKVRTGGQGAKFGLQAADLPGFLSLARANDVLVHGLHAHLGSGILDPAHWREVLLQLASIAEQVGTVSVLDLGGGIGVPGDPEQPPFDVAGLGRHLDELRQAYPGYALWLEPGRFLVAEAGVLLARVTQVARKGETVRVGIDAGMHTLLRPALYNAWHEIVDLDRLDAPQAGVYDIVGPICESGDVLGFRRGLPEPGEGDVILVANVGAYGAVMASGYNRRALPEEDVIDG